MTRQNKLRMRQLEDKFDALEMLGAEYPRPLFTGEKYQSWQLKVGARKPENKFNWIKYLIP